jgi:hypothetical protein
MTAEIAQFGRCYEIEPRRPELQLRLIEDGEEVGGGVFPASETETANTEAYAEAMEEGEDWVASRQAMSSP